MCNISLQLKKIHCDILKMFSDLSQSPLSKNLQRLFWLRNIAIVAQCLTFAIVYWTIDIGNPMGANDLCRRNTLSVKSIDMGTITP